MNHFVFIDWVEIPSKASASVWFYVGELVSQLSRAPVLKKLVWMRLYSMSCHFLVCCCLVIGTNNEVRCILVGYLSIIAPNWVSTFYFYHALQNGVFSKLQHTNFLLSGNSYILKPGHVAVFTFCMFLAVSLHCYFLSSSHQTLVRLMPLSWKILLFACHVVFTYPHFFIKFLVKYQALFC